jgi:hypothetical protein
MQIDPNKHYEAIFHTQRGDFTVELVAKQAPISAMVTTSTSSLRNGRAMMSTMISTRSDDLQSVICSTITTAPIDRR